MKTPHPHAVMIAEWIKDISRVVEVCLDATNKWHVTSPPSWVTDYKYRFADTAKPEIVSPLTDGEFYSYNGTVKPMREIANAAAARAIKDLPLLDCELNYSDLHIMWAQAKGDGMLLLRAIARAVRDDYIKQVQAGKR